MQSKPDIVWKAIKYTYMIWLVNLKVTPRAPGHSKWHTDERKPEEIIVHHDGVAHLSGI
jgi:hypothetical protein